MARRWTVGEVAQLARVTVRTLHHYDEAGVLVPSERSDGGYRLYSERDLERLHQILLYRELGFPLKAIRHLLDEPAIDRAAALRAQRELLVAQRRRTEAVIRAVDRTLESMEKGTPMTMESMAEGFDALGDAPAEVRAHHAQHGREAEERWGETDLYRESMRRVKGFSRQDWEQARREGGETEMRMAALLEAGVDPEGEEAMELAEAMRQHISRWFYPCSYQVHAGLADMYEADERFRAYYEKRAAGLAGFVARSIRANAVRAWDEGRS
jgi:MerR family transcriptional regulator, thiopeptide resistance regulator